MYDILYIDTRCIDTRGYLNSKNKGEFPMKKYVCDVCGWEYDPAVGVPEMGIAPNTPWEQINDDFTCPLCGVDKTEFSEME